MIHFLVVNLFKNNKKAQGKSHFSALVILLCFIGGYLPSRAFGFNNLSVFFCLFILFLMFQYLYTDTAEYSIAQNFYFFKPKRAMLCETYKNHLFILYSVHSLLTSFYVLPMERKPYMLIGPLLIVLKMSKEYCLSSEKPFGRQTLYSIK